MTDAEKREAAHQFINRWMGRGNEDEDGRSYWLEFLSNVMGMENPTERVNFEKKVIVNGNTKRIDVYIPETHMFKLEWVKEIDNSLPTLLIVSGVFQYFHEEEIIAFIKGCGKAFPKGEMLFDATSESGLKFTNWFIKRTGNASAIMYFGINDSKEFANKCSMELLEEKTFFPEALKMLGKKLSFVTKVSMKVAEKKKQVIILRLKLN